MDTTIEQAIRDAVEKFVNDGFMFTAFDVTRTVRKDLGKGTFVSHSDVNSIVQSMYGNGEMNSHVRDLINVGANVEPWLYYHPYSDVANYDPHWIDNDPDQDSMKADVSSTSTPATPATSSGGYVPPTLDLDDDDEDDVDTGCGSATAGVTGAHVASPASSPVASAVKVKLGKNEHRLTKEGRLQIPINMARTAGFAPADNVTVVDNGGKLTITKGPLTAVNSVSVNSVNKDGRIRIPMTILGKISTNPKGEIFKVERDNSEIVIEVV